MCESSRPVDFNVYNKKTRVTRVRFINVRSIQNKKASLNEQLLQDEVGVCVVVEMNTKKCPKMKGYNSFSYLSR